MHGIKINYCLMICLSCLLMLASCADKGQDTKVITPTLSENNFVMEVSRKMEKLPGRVMFPTDELTETDYVMCKGKKMNYTISISNAGQLVTINPGAISGKRDASIQSIAYYNMTKGLFAGGGLLYASQMVAMTLS